MVCVMSVFFGEVDECHETTSVIFGVECGRSTCFKYVEMWEPCTKDNVEVGDIVRFSRHGQGDSNYKHTISYIYKNGIELIVGDDGYEDEYSFPISDFEREVK